MYYECNTDLSVVWQRWDGFQYVQVDKIKIMIECNRLQTRQIVRVNYRLTRATTTQENNLQTVFAMQIKHAFVRTVGAHELATAQNDTTQNDTDTVCIWGVCVDV